MFSSDLVPFIVSSIFHTIRICKFICVIKFILYWNLYFSSYSSCNLGQIIIIFSINYSILYFMLNHELIPLSSSKCLLFMTQFGGRLSPIPPLVSSKQDCARMTQLTRSYARFSPPPPPGLIVSREEGREGGKARMEEGCKWVG